MAATLSKEEVNQLQQLIRELVLTDSTPGVDPSSENFDQISYTIKQILEMGRDEAFADQLSSFVHKKEGEIEKMCNSYYQEFVQSVEQVLKVRLGTSAMKTKIFELNKELQGLGLKTVDKV